MWKELQKSPSFFLLFKKECRYHIIITDYIKIWEIYYSEDAFLKCLKESNLGLEINTLELTENGTQMLLNPTECKSLNISHNESSLIVSMTRFYGYPLHLRIELNEGSHELFFQEVTQQLLKTVKDLKCSETKLRKLLTKKDEEIEEYKSLGGKIRYTALPPYDDDTHMQTHTEYEKNFGEIEISSTILERRINVSRQNTNEIMIDSKKNIKQEPVSQEDISSNLTTRESNDIKQEYIKNEITPIIPTRTKRKKMLNI
ncbi:uncharacterized protein LOC125065201 [Vanessa atalanta]|uniref:uncharacterized protein LOC125065201 n=1 Tax=Vanessa atalanta TaxID=42275 RepID=UPI001FCE1023|nr:uncharacterized protein LOC125065201 [Vanessa atalanta]